MAFFTSGNNDLTHFETWLRAKPLERDDKMLLPNGDWGNIHDVVEVLATGIRTVYQPEEVVIEPDDPIVQVNPIEPRYPHRDIRIIAALVNPVAADDTGQEVLTLLNTLPFNIDLTGWQLVTVSPSGHEQRQALSGVINAGAVLQVVWNTGNLRNAGSEISLVNAKGAPVDAVAYDDTDGACTGQTIIF